MSSFRNIKITCPACNTEGPYTVWDSVNVDLDPELKSKVMDGSLPNISATENLQYAHKEDDSGIDDDYSYYVSHLKDRDVYIKLKNGNVCPPIEVREIDGE